MNGRCRSEVEHHGRTLQCQGIQGHQSVHYCGDVWWTNQRDSYIWIIMAWLIAGATLIGLIYWLVKR